MSLFDNLKLKYRVLTQLIALLCWLPSVGLLYFWAPIFELLEAQYSKGIAGGIILVIFFIQVIINFFIVSSIYKKILVKLIGITDQEYSLLLWCHWYPDHWFKN